MKGLVFDIKKFALHDGPGIRTTIFMKGCPLRCWWCHNPESIRDIPEVLTLSHISNSNEKCTPKTVVAGKEYGVDELMSELIKDIVFYEESGGGVTFSGGEPMVQIEFLREILTECKKNNIHTAIDTSGYVPMNSFEQILELTDIFLYDIKLIDDQEHLKYTEVSNKLIMDNLKKLSMRGTNTNIRLPLIPNITDTKKNLTGIADFVKSLPGISRIDLLPYNILTESKYQRFNRQSKLGKLNAQSEEQLLKIKSFFCSFGFNVTLRG